ncbi:unnamed protein product [Sphagnum tenellum]
MLNLLLHITAEDIPYLPKIKPLLSGKANVTLDASVPQTAFEVASKAKSKGASGVITTSLPLLKLLQPESKKLSISDYAGSIIKKFDVEFLIIDPLENLFTVNYGKFILERFLSKFLTPEKWIFEPEFKWELFSPDKTDDIQNYFETCDLIAVDIETVRDDPDRKLPKDLGFISAMMVRSYCYHKNESNDGGKYAKLSYNAKDTYYTLLSALALLSELPDYSWTNYFKEFPVVFPCILCEHTGLAWDFEVAQELKGQVEINQAGALRKLQTMVANPDFNPGSWQQTQKLFEILGSKDVKNTDVKGRDKVAFRHPLNKRILSEITTYRESSKLNGSYFKEGVTWNGRVFYALNPSGTDTGRLASRESQFWCGFQIQNIPSDEAEDDTSMVFKDCLISDPGFLLGEADYSQNEARGTAYLSGDTALLKAVEDITKDFHGLNASDFFGIPYESIVRSEYSETELRWIHKTVNNAIRKLSKRTNHGANYNMGAGVMLDTMGIENVLQAKQLLKLPNSWTLLQVTTHLLAVFDKTYPVVRGPWYDKVKSDVKNTGFLVGPTGWTRRCFGDPYKNKRDLNAYAAHQPQSLGAMLLNEAFIKVFNEIWLPNQEDFKLCTQIHDSLLFQYREGREDLAWKVADCMKNKTEIIDTFGIKRTMTVPVDLKGNGRRWSNLKALKRPLV